MGAAVMQGVALMDFEGLLSFWPLVFGVPAGLAAGGLTVALRGRGTIAGRVGLYWLAAVLTLFGLAATWWNIMWGIPLTSLEGAWLWPLAAVPLLSAALAWRAARLQRVSKGSAT
jgi:hypothetical protein